MFTKSPQDLRRQVSEWVKKGYLITLKKGIYIFNDTFRKQSVSLHFIANYLVTPSYLSLEYALKYYDLIPEKVTVLTSVTSKKTVIYKNSHGIFEYRSIKNDLFFGYKNKKDKERCFSFFGE